MQTKLKLLFVLLLAINKVASIVDDDKTWYKFTLVSITNANQTTDSDGVDELNYLAVDLYNDNEYQEHIIV